jgi:two-component system cell cycle sensor histidine kinase/response regulator CckA
MRERIFEPFITNMPFGEGTGLGLPMVYSILMKHNGFFDVSSAPGEGTTFRVFLPMYTATNPIARTSRLATE